MTVKIRLLGPLEVKVDSVRATLSGPQQRALLATLVINAGRAISASDLIDELWPGKAYKVRANTLHAQMARLRKTLTVNGTAAVEIHPRGGGYDVEVPAESLDIDRFVGLRRRAVLLAGKDTAQAVALLRQALGLWRGEALQDAVIGRRCAAVAAGLDESRAQVQEQLARLCIAVGDPATAVADLSGLTRLYPMRETMLATLMQALDACGRRAEALGVFQEARARFATELGAEPGQAMQQQHLRILQGAGR